MLFDEGNDDHAFSSYEGHYHFRALDRNGNPICIDVLRLEDGRVIGVGAYGLHSAGQWLLSAVGQAA